MKVFIPEDVDMTGVRYLTKGKEYDCSDSDFLGMISDDDGNERLIIVENSRSETCSHLNEQSAWKIVEEKGEQNDAKKTNYITDTT